MTYAIGDIHGHAGALKALINAISPTEEDTIICLGDYVDRGPDSKGVVDYLLELRKTHQLIHLKGNHEFHLERARESQSVLDFYRRPLVGGTETLDSYGGSIDSIPKEHWDFMMHEALLYHETDTHIFVHGGLDFRYPPSEQDAETLCWSRFYFPKPHVSGKTMICGHTIQEGTPRNYQGHSICIDTGIYSANSGWLTGLEVETGKYVQAKETGKTREGRLSVERDDDL